MPARRITPPWNHAFAVLLTAATFLVRLALFGEQKPLLILLVFPVAITSYFAGLPAALTATALAALGALYLLVPPFGSLAPRSTADLVHLAIFCAASAAVAWAMDAAHRAGRRVSEARQRAIFDEAGVGIVEVDQDDRLIAVNNRFGELLGYAPDELVGKSLQEITAPEDRPITLDLDRKVHAGERDRFEFEKRYLRRDGTRLWVHMVISIVRDRSGAFVRAIATAEDIGARKRAEQALVDSEERYRTLFMRMTEGFALGEVICAEDGTPRDLRFLEVNEAFEQQTGLAWDAMRGRTLREILPNVEPVWIERYGRVALGGDPDRFELYNRDLDRHFSVYCFSPARGRFAILFTDDTKRKRSEEELRASRVAVDAALARTGEAEQRLRSVVENLPSGLVVADLSTRDLHWNAEALRIHGYTGEGDEHKFLEALVAEHELRSLSGDPVPIERWPLPLLLNGENFRDYELRVRNTRLGWERVFSYSGVVIADGGSTGLGLLSIRDVTDRARAEEAIRVANRHKDEFLSVLSHELRNPLAPIRSSVYVLERADPGGEKARRARSVIARQAEHLTRLVDDLLDVTRIARGKILLHRDRLDLREAVRRAVDDARLEIEKEGVTVRILLPDDRLWADADATRVTQILGNLLTNARKFTAEGGEITVALREVEASAELSVRDTGAGIDPALLPNVFDAFVQGKRTLARSEGGLGLGLALVKGLVELHGGSVAAHSDGPGRGAEFIVRLPLIGPLVNERTASPRSRPAATRRRVLVVDDNADAAESLAELVEMFGHRVDVAFDGPSAIEKVRRDRPDVVLCDIGLPGMTGYDVARALRSELDGGVQLVAISGYAQSEDVQKAVEAGFDEHIAKPAHPDRIAEILA